MLEIRNGKVKIAGEETTDAAKIGQAVLEDIRTVEHEIRWMLKDHRALISIVDANKEVENLNNYMHNNTAFDFCIPITKIPFQNKYGFTATVIGLIEMIKNGQLVYKR